MGNGNGPMTNVGQPMPYDDNNGMPSMYVPQSDPNGGASGSPSVNIVETIDVSVRLTASSRFVETVAFNQIATLPSNAVPAPNNGDYNNGQEDTFPDSQIPSVRMDI